jgi:hypothetical protein
MEILFRVCFMFMPISQCRMAGWLVNTELERIWKETIVAIRVGGLWKNMKNRSSQDSCVQAEIQTEHVCNTSLEPCGYKLLLATHTYCSTIYIWTQASCKIYSDDAGSIFMRRVGNIRIFRCLATWHQKSTGKWRNISVHKFREWKNCNIAVLCHRLSDIYAYVNSALRREISIFPSMALQPLWTSDAFSGSLFINCRLDSLDRRSTRHKAATYTQNNTNTELTHRQASMPRVVSNSRSQWSSGRRRFMP